MTDAGANWIIAICGVLSLFVARQLNGSSIWVRVVERPCPVFEQEINAQLSFTTQILSPRKFLNTGTTVAAVIYDCAGVYLETDF